MKPNNFMIIKKVTALLLIIVDEPFLFNLITPKWLKNDLQIKKKVFYDFRIASSPNIN